MVVFGSVCVLVLCVCVCVISNSCVVGCTPGILNCVCVLIKKTLPRSFFPVEKCNESSSLDHGLSEGSDVGLICLLFADLWFVCLQPQHAGLQHLSSPGAVLSCQ